MTFFAKESDERLTGLWRDTMGDLVHVGCWHGRKSTQMLLTTTGSRMMMPIKRRVWGRWKKSAMNTMALTVTGAWQPIWNGKAVATEFCEFVNVTQSMAKPGIRMARISDTI